MIEPLRQPNVLLLLEFCGSLVVFIGVRTVVCVHTASIYPSLHNCSVHCSDANSRAKVSKCFTLEGIPFLTR
jgi:hypothetical protein